ncbi:FAD-dependent oxidoreductase [Pseudomonas aeruginosa]|nr:FAD-dependent oxidoreductase [Pseudomonas aeruginosa]
MSGNRGVVYLGPGKVEVQNIPYPKMQDPQGRQIDHGVILRVVSTNICGSDQHMVRGRTTAPEGLVLGHEITGEVVEIGRGVETMKIGDLVSVPFNVACGHCRTCKEQHTGVCLTVNPARAGGAYGYVDMGGWVGGQVLDTMAIENFISVQETEGPKLARALEEHVRHYEVDIMNLQRASKLVPAKNTGELHEVQFESGGSLKAKTLILATGARWREMGVPGEQEYKAKGVCFCPHCDGPLFKGKRVAVIGGGNSGVEAAIDLAGIVAHVTLLEFDSKLRADAVLQRKLYSLPNVEVITSALTSEVKGDGQKVTGLVYKDRNSEEFKSIELEGIFVQIGLLPNTEWLKGSVELSPRGEIIVDARGETSLPGIFAAGDVTTVPYKQIVIAVGEGAKASLSAFDHLIRTSAPE